MEIQGLVPGGGDNVCPTYILHSGVKGDLLLTMQWLRQIVTVNQEKRPRGSEKLRSGREESVIGRREGGVTGRQDMGRARGRDPSVVGVMVLERGL